MLITPREILRFPRYKERKVKTPGSKKRSPKPVALTVKKGVGKGVLKKKGWEKEH